MKTNTICKCLGLPLAVIMTMSCADAALASSSSKETVQETVTYEQSDAREMIEDINEFRTSESEAWYYNEDGFTKTTVTGLSEMTYDYTLEACAMQRAAEIALSFSHERPNGTKYYTVGNGTSILVSSENLASGYTTEEDAFEGWKETDEDYYGQGHRRAMLSSYYNAVGIAHVVCDGTDYWVQEFAHLSASEMNTTATAANNSTTEVSVEIALDHVSSVVEETALNAIELESGSTAQAPSNLELTVQLCGTCSSHHVTEDPVWTSDDTSVATVSNGTITAKAAGSTTLEASVLGTTVTVPVTVTQSSSTYVEKASSTTTTTTPAEKTTTNTTTTTTSVSTPSTSVSTPASSTAVTTPTTTNAFSDVSSSDYYYDAVCWAVQNSITSGTSATTFSPGSTCTRAQAVTFLWRAAGSPSPSGVGVAFTDVNPGDYYYDAVRWAVENGVTSGTSATTFSPSDSCTRAQIVTFLYRANGSPAVGIASFSDVSSSDYYASAVAWAVENGITNGTGGSAFSPSNDCTRAQIVTFLYRNAA